MKKRMSQPLDGLAIDVVDYMFVEFLIRRHLYSRFIENVRRFNPRSDKPRELIRARIRLCLNSSNYFLRHLIFAFFPFYRTSEGFVFWNKAADDWADFSTLFFKII